MRKAQKRALEKGELLSPGSEPMTSQSFSSLDPHPRVRYKAIGALLPILFLFVFLLTGIWRDGLSSMEEVTAQMSVFSFSDWRAVISASENSILLLAYAAVLGWVVAYFLAMLVGKLPFKQGLKASYLGLKAALLPAAILILAWSLKSICDQLETGPFLVNAVSDQIPPVLFPAIVFVLGGIVAFATGTSWGTMAILIPTAVPMAFALDGDVYGLLTIMTFGAILDGAILGDHCSPISDTTLMSSIASSCDHMDHVKTQMPYALWVGSIALLIGYLPAAAGYASWPAFFVGVALMLGGFWLFSQREEAQGPVEEKKKARPASQNT
jgi:Na+/H+ antiporter NhaC